MIREEKITLENGNVLVVKLRWNDECRNGYKTFAITGTLYQSEPLCERNVISCGCLHDDIREHAPKYAECIPYHLVSAYEPMHYVANTLYWIKEGQLDNARESAVWPDATDDELRNATAETLKDRLPAVMQGFKDMLHKFAMIECS
jgi:hypothetical protein